MKPNTFDTRNRDAKAVVADLVAMGKERCRLVIVGSHKLDPIKTADALRDQWSTIVELVGFRPGRIVTGCAPGGAEKAARLVAKSVTGKLAAVFHRPELVHSIRDAEMFSNVLLARTGDVALILATSSKPTCTNLRRSLMEWNKGFHQVEVG